jgi:hypothetical protein
MPFSASAWTYDTASRASKIRKDMHAQRVTRGNTSAYGWSS